MQDIYNYTNYIWDAWIKFMSLLIQVCVADYNSEKGQASSEKFGKEYPGCYLFVHCDVSKIDDVKSR